MRIGLSTIFEEVEQAYEEQLQEEATEKFEQEYKQCFDSLDNETKEYILEITKGNQILINTCLRLWEYLHEKNFNLSPQIRKRKYYTKQQVLNKFQKNSTIHPSFGRVRLMEKTAEELGISYSAVRKHIYQK